MQYIKNIIYKMLNKVFYFNIEKNFYRDSLNKRFISFSIEPTNICNANCSFCAYSFKTIKGGTMHTDIFKLALKQYIDAGGGEISFTPTVGDVLVDKNIVDKIEYANQFRQIKNINFYTNGINLHRFDLKRLLNSGIKRITISTAWGDRKMFERLYKVKTYNKLNKNIQKILKIHKDLNSNVKLILAIRVDENIDIKKQIKALKDINHNIKITKNPNKKGYDNWGGKITKQDLPIGCDIKTMPKYGNVCSEFFRGLNVSYNGDLNMCHCRDYDKELKIGNINDGILNVWNSPARKSFIANWENKKPKICKKCTFYQSIDDYIANNRIKLFKKFILNR